MIGCDFIKMVVICNNVNLPTFRLHFMKTVLKQAHVLERDETFDTCRFNYSVIRGERRVACH